jgi:hypothetical protein
MNPADLRNELGKPYEFYTITEAVEHARLLDGLEGPGVIGFSVAPQDSSADRWRVVVCARDQQGILSILAGLFTAFGVDVERADVFTVAAALGLTDDRSPRRGRSRTRGSRAGVDRPTVLDIFDVTISGDNRDFPWPEIERDLRSYVRKLADGSVDGFAKRSSIV